MLTDASEEYAASICEVKDVTPCAVVNAYRSFRGMQVDL
jgi:hypothetical protein